MHCFDAHVHCGIWDEYTPEGFENYYRHVTASPINGAVLFPYVEDIYDRDDPDFTDTPEWQQHRRQVNEYVLTPVKDDFELYPFLFVWNDYAVEDLTHHHRGIKWHRHANEPVYHYKDPLCLRAIEEIRHRNMPVLFEEVISKTVHFIEVLAPDVTVILPHMGFLNGGYQAVLDHGLFERPNVYTDTSLATTGEILDYLNRFGEDRILFGSDFPYGDPVAELDKVLRLPIPSSKIDAITGLNLHRLMSESNV